MALRRRHNLCSSRGPTALRVCSVCVPLWQQWGALSCSLVPGSPTPQTWEVSQFDRNSAIQSWTLWSFGPDEAMRGSSAEWRLNTWLLLQTKNKSQAFTIQDESNRMQSDFQRVFLFPFCIPLVWLCGGLRQDDSSVSAREGHKKTLRAFDPPPPPPFLALKYLNSVSALGALNCFIRSQGAVSGQLLSTSTNDKWEAIYGPVYSRAINRIKL